MDQKILLIKKLKKYLLKTFTNIKKPKVIVSNSIDQKTNNFVKRIKAAKLKKISSSIKFCKLAEGEADIYPRLHSIKKWDIAAGDAILRAAGGMLLDAKKDYNYNSPTSNSGIFCSIIKTKVVRLNTRVDLKYINVLISNLFFFCYLTIYINFIYLNLNE